MKISFTDIGNGPDTLVFVRMTRKEAIRTIESLAAQMVHDTPNAGRYEVCCADGTEFSIAVSDDFGEE